MTVAKVWDGSGWIPVLGVQGPRGDTGAQGPKGDTGAQGPPGGQVAQSYAITSGYTKDRAMNPQAMTLGEVATVLATLIDDMKAAGLIQP